jgi:ethanolamine utilization protein EutN
MKLGQVIGRVTLNTQEPSYKGGRFYMIQPLSPEQVGGGSLAQWPKANTLVAFDTLGAGEGDIVIYSESGEAAAAFEIPTPVDALVCALVDRLHYQPPNK